MTAPIYLLVTIDTECDKGPQWQIQRPMRFTSVTHGIPDLLTPLYQRYGIKPTYLLSPEVIRDDDSAAVLAAVENCELGAHLHGEFIEPQTDWQATHTNMPQMLYDASVEWQKLVNLTELFTKRFGYRPISFRAGRFGISQHTLGYLCKLGYRADSSVTPFWSHRFEGRAWRDYWGAPLQPYHPSERDPRRVGMLPLLQVPVTILNPAFADWPRWVLRLVNSSVQSKWGIKMLKRLKRYSAKTLWLRPQRSTAGELIKLAEMVIRRGNDSRPVVLNLMYHSVEVIPEASPYAQNQAEVQAILDSQALLFDHLRSCYAIESVGLGELYACLPG